MALTNKEIGRRIHARRKEIGRTLDDIAKVAGVGNSTISRYESGVIKQIKLPVIEAIAESLNVNPSWLIGKTDNPAPVKPIVSISNILPMPNTNLKPELGAIACGQPILAEQNIENYVKVPDWVECDFVLRCKGDSMIGARIFDGDAVCIRQQPEVESGEIAAVLIDDEATLKRVKLFPDHIVLEPENPSYRPMVFWDEDMAKVRILGKATYFISRVI